MSKVRQTRWFSLVLIVAFLAASTVVRAAAVEDANDFNSNQEEQFEDKSETGDKDDKSNSFTSNFFLICEVSHPPVSCNYDRNSRYTDLNTAKPVPIFLRNEALLI
ncbi:MAG TPA: hypothetical protein VFE50_21610 [Cyclobacteriaceae bacterium]|nr:hypothetical protein [Cyclobacteriaceae bacterium]